MQNFEKRRSQAVETKKVCAVDAKKKSLEDEERGVYYYRWGFDGLATQLLRRKGEKLHQCGKGKKYKGDIKKYWAGWSRGKTQVNGTHPFFFGE